MKKLLFSICMVVALLTTPLVMHATTVQEHITALQTQFSSLVKMFDGLIAKGSELASDLTGTSTTSSKDWVGVEKSEVKIVNGKPKLLVNGKELPSTVVSQVYYQRVGSGEAQYGNKDWVVETKKRIDQLKSINGNIFVVRVWWPDMDTSTSRPNSIKDALNFAPLDEVMDYAKSKQVYVVINNVLEVYSPDWWKKENNFPPFNKEKKCSECETDSAGNQYLNPSMNSTKSKADFGEYVKAVVSRYKDHPALLGWIYGIGSTGENYYGPSYIQLGNFPGGGGTGRNDNLVTDYSPFFQQAFKTWLKTKYSSDAKLQAAWGNTTSTLEGVTIPTPSELINGKGIFPDLAKELNVINPSIFDLSKTYDTLTQKGKDFYGFRDYMRDQEHAYYINLFKSNDPKHILIARGGSEDNFVLKNTSVDGVTFDPHLSFTTAYSDPNPLALDQMYMIMHMVELANQNKKIVILTPENHPRKELYVETGKWENGEQLNYVEKIGEAVKCIGNNYAGYVSDLSSSSTSVTVPSLFSKEGIAVAKKISDYTPSSNCKSVIPKETYDLNCSKSEYKSLCQTRLAKALSEYSGINIGGTTPNNTGTTTNNTNTNANTGTDSGSCGDNICQTIEKTSGMCPKDCTSSTGTTGNANTTSADSGSCGDGICQAPEKSSGMCAKDCTSAKAATPVTVSCKFDATKYANYYSDLKSAFGYDATKLLKHWLNYGISEGRTPCGSDMPTCKFSANTYADLYSDLKSAFGYDGSKLLTHYTKFGVYEGRDVCRTTKPVATAVVPQGESGLLNSLASSFQALQNLLKALVK